MISSVLTGSIGFHYFAGFAGGRKSLMPGVAARRSIYFNHLLVLNQNGLGRDPDVRVAKLDGNPVNEDLMDAARLVDRPMFVFNTILDQHRHAKDIRGHWENAHRAGCEDYLQVAQLSVPQRATSRDRQCGRISARHQRHSGA